MQVNVTTLEGLKRRISGKIEPEVVSQHLDRAMRELAKSAQIRGFRPGKAPKAMLEKRYGEQIKADVSGQLLEEYFPKALEQGHVEPVSTPEVERAEIEPDGSMAFEIIVEVAPKVSLQLYKGLTAKQPVVEVSEQEIEARLEQVRQQNSTLEPLEQERPLAEGDWAEINFQGLLGGKPFEGATAENYRLEVGAKRLIVDLEQGLVGMQKGEDREIPATFPANYGNAKLAGKQVLFKVHLNSILKRVVPAADDELAKDAGEESLDALKAKIKQQIEKGKTERAEADARESLLDDLLAKNPVEAPARMVEHRLESMQEQLKRNLVSQGLPAEQAQSLLDSTRESGRERAEREVKISFLLEAVAEQESLSVSDAELDQRYQEIAESAKQTVEAVAAMFQKEGQVETLKRRILEGKTLELLKAHATIVPAEPAPAEEPEE